MGKCPCLKKVWNRWNWTRNGGNRWFLGWVVHWMHWTHLHWIRRRKNWIRHQKRKKTFCFVLFNTPWVFCLAYRVGGSIWACFLIIDFFNHPNQLLFNWTYFLIPPFNTGWSAILTLHNAMQLKLFKSPVHFFFTPELPLNKLLSPTVLL